MENRIKSARPTCSPGAASVRANQLRLWFAAFAYVLLRALRRIWLSGTAMALATCGTIRLKLLKFGALVTTSVRRVKIAMASSCPYQSIFAHAHERISVAARCPLLAGGATASRAHADKDCESLPRPQCALMPLRRTG